MLTRISDRQLRQDVIDELDFEPSIDSANICVVVDSGVVNLSGSVASYGEKLAAGRAAGRVRGVRAINQRLCVYLAGGKRGDDDAELCRRACSVLAWQSSLPHQELRLDVRHGWVRLEGRVDWNFQRVAAEAAVRQLAGVVGVHNCISVSPTRQAQPMDVRQRIIDALKRLADVQSASIRVSVREAGVVSLEGRVGNREERAAIERAAWSAPGVVAVEDNLRIG